MNKNTVIWLVIGSLFFGGLFGLMDMRSSGFAFHVVLTYINSIFIVFLFIRELFFNK
ncbi:hypothetical protein GWK91_12805 [Virgibacillus sp. MSP4-1]|uniref:hypothetical protein n=1 Tax=Virgibacillus sp. MSP4-1 TaxID=2700081 RepID=UPI0003A3E81F|nr:hypothetical protein [Virgibacillus sp. MSP4-1]QHS23774.1 hypothetical protein GWK91_12805 [Virgibacillus sp. MSP4-1]